ncbi:MAG: cyclodeaminase/cyclohydrolase family protein [Oscillospiraceae bacterium]
MCAGDGHDTTRSSSRKEVFHMTDQTLTTGRSLSEFTAQLASAQPAPGGGGAAALAGALAASLAAMAANVTAANPRYADRHDALATLAASCDAQRTTLLALIDADAAGFLPLQRAYAIPKDDPTRAARLADAAHTACLAPLAMLEHCEQVALLLPAALSTASPLLRSDVGCAAALCSAAAEAAELNVLVNTGLLAPDDRAATEARAARLRATVVQCCAQTADAVRAALRGEG